MPGASVTGCRKSLRSAVLLTALVAVALPSAAFAQQVVYRFKGAADGSGPSGGLAADGNNVVYGTTNQGGTAFMGTVFKLTRSGNKWKHEVIHNFAGGSDGAFPEGDLLVKDGVIYGTTTLGGLSNATCESGCGTVFKLEQKPNKKWKETIIHRFAGGGKGREPRAGLIFRGGALYGTTYSGGKGSGFGTVFRLIDNSGMWSRETLYAFQGGSDGGNPEAEVVFFQGELYGLTTREGIKTGQCSQDSRGCGTAFKLTPPPSGKAPWPHTVLYRFKGSNDGMEPSGPLTLSDGKFYGTTHRGGKGNKGTVFELRFNGGQTAFLRTLIHEFAAGKQGKDPQGVIFRGSDLYGLTSTDGSLQQAGTIFRLRPKNGTWKFNQLYAFKGTPDGESPQSRLLLTGDGFLKGVTFSGGKDNGTVFEMFRPQ